MTDRYSTALRWPGGWPRISPTTTMRAIAEEIGSAHGYTVDEMRGLPVPRPISRVRQQAMATMHIAGFTHPQIVRFFHLKNHTSSLYASRKASRALAQQEAEAA